MVEPGVLDVFWMCFGCLFDVFWVSFGCVLDVFWMCLVVFLNLFDVLWVSFGCIWIFTVWILFDIFSEKYSDILFYFFKIKVFLFHLPSINPHKPTISHFSRCGLPVVATCCGLRQAPWLPWLDRCDKGDSSVEPREPGSLSQTTTGSHNGEATTGKVRNGGFMWVYAW